MSTANINALTLPSLPLVKRFQLPHWKPIYCVVLGNQALQVGLFTAPDMAEALFLRVFAGGLKNKYD